jgi:hypothetical protein
VKKNCSYPGQKKWFAVHSTPHTSAHGPGSLAMPGLPERSGGKFTIRPFMGRGNNPGMPDGMAFAMYRSGDAGDRQKTGAVILSKLLRNRQQPVGGIPALSLRPASLRAFPVSFQRSSLRLIGHANLPVPCPSAITGPAHSPGAVCDAVSPGSVKQGRPGTIESGAHGMPDTGGKDEPVLPDNRNREKSSCNY